MRAGMRGRSRSTSESIDAGFGGWEEIEISVVAGV